MKYLWLGKQLEVSERRRDDAGASIESTITCMGGLYV